MNDTTSAQHLAIAKFRALHESGCFVLPNPWDAGTAVYLEHLGFAALATTSAGFAFSRALPDSVTVVGRGAMLDHIREIVAATTLPVNADFQNGYADNAEDVAASVSLCIATGVAGLSIEDATGNLETPLYQTDLAIDRIKAARAAIDASGIPVVLTARCEAFLVGHPDPMATAHARLLAYAEAGADCLYAPGLAVPDQIAALVKAVAPKPINVLMPVRGHSLLVSQLADLGVRRVSVGSGLARVAWGAFIRAASELLDAGSFACFADATPFNELNEVFTKNSLA